MWISLLGLLLVVVFAGLGAWRGALESALRLLALAGSYAAAVVAGARSGARVAELLGVAPWLGGPIAASVAFLAAWLLFGIGALVVRRMERRRLDGRERSGWDRTAGAGFGAARGAVVALLIGWLSLFGAALRGSGLAPQLPELGGPLPELSAQLVESGARAVLGDEEPAARLTTRLVSRPEQTVAGLREVLENPEVTALQNDAAFWDAVASGRIESALRSRSLRRVAEDPGLRDAVAELGLLEAGVSDDPRAFEASLGDALRELSPRLRALRGDPELQSLGEDPEVERLVRRGDTLGLLAHPGVQRLVQRVLASASAGS